MKENGSHGLRAKTTAWFTAVARAEPFWWYKVVGSPYARPGVPDFVCCYRGVFGALELKRPGEKESGLRPRQEFEVGAIQRAHGIVGVAETMDEVRAFLDRLRAHAEGI